MSGVLVVRPSSLGDVVYALALVSDIAAHRPGRAGRLGRRRRVCRSGASRPADPPRGAARASPLAPCALDADDVARHGRHSAARCAGNATTSFSTCRNRSRAPSSPGSRAGLVTASTAPTSASRSRRSSTMCIMPCRATCTSSTAAAESPPLRWATPSTVRRAGASRRRPPRPRCRPGRMRWRSTRRAAPTSCGPRSAGERSSRISRARDSRRCCRGATSDERARSERIASGAEGAVVPPRQTLPELATLSRHAEVVVGVDTGLTHLAAALGTSTVAIFTATDPRFAGVARTGAARARRRRQWTCSVAGGRRGPLRAAAAAGAALLANARPPMARRLYTLLWWLVLPLLPLRLWWRGRREPGYRLRIGERFGRYDGDCARPPRRRDLDPRGVAGRDARGSAVARTHRARAARMRRSCSRT